MAALVCKGASCVCSFGMMPCTLNAGGTVKAEGTALATVRDHGITNLRTFGMCTSLTNPAVAAATAAALGVMTPQPCIPQIVTPWSGGSPTVKSEGSSVITGASTTNCLYGGVISISRLTQNTVKS